ncbi:MAG: SCO family protein [Elusimicrobia bacterium]|nr:SCO family protein [Elusimicrobiota bacterium]
MRALIVVAAVFSGACAKPEPLAVLPEFAMTAVSARGTADFGRKDLLGKVWIADFIFTHCAGPCPLLSARLSALGERLPATVGLLSVGVDSEGDTPERLRAYAKRYGARPERWVFLRGTPAQTYHLLYAGFRLPLSVDPTATEEQRAEHSTRFVLVDKDGAIRGYYDGLSDADNAALARDARRLLEVGS